MQAVRLVLLAFPASHISQLAMFACMATWPAGHTLQAVPSTLENPGSQISQIVLVASLALPAVHSVQLSILCCSATYPSSQNKHDDVLPAAR